jgi:nitroimidazol reductase NimA-like FMN-containing flavoprotein (pyridoxamine 5'-phosphate oxidase superfamily)
MKQRDRIKLTPKECWDFIEEGTHTGNTMFLATNGKDGFPHLVSMGYAIKDGAVIFATYRKSQKVVNLRRDPRAAIILEAMGTIEYSEKQGVMARGHCEIIDDGGVDALKMLHEQAERLSGVRSPRSDYMEERGHKRVMLKFIPEKWASWDHRKLPPGTY